MDASTLEFLTEDEREVLLRANPVDPLCELKRLLYRDATGVWRSTGVDGRIERRSRVHRKVTDKCVQVVEIGRRISNSAAGNAWGRGEFGQLTVHNRARGAWRQSRASYHLMATSYR